MNSKQTKAALAAAVVAAQAAGRLMRRNLNSVKRVNLATRYDIKLELDVRCQKLIERILHRAFPDVALLGEEGVSGSPEATARWVVDPIDGTMNYTFGIPHAAVSIALQVRTSAANDSFKTMVGVIYDPFQDELWTAIRGEPARCNGKVIHVSHRKELRDAMVAIGFAKSEDNLRKSLPYFGRLVRRVCKVRIMGSAALSLTYVAMGRLDAYVERRIRLWDFAAGGLIIECAGGTFWSKPIRGAHRYSMVASNRLIGKQLRLPR